MEAVKNHSFGRGVGHFGKKPSILGFSSMASREVWPPGRFTCFYHQKNTFFGWSVRVPGSKKISKKDGEKQLTTFKRLFFFVVLLKGFEKKVPKISIYKVVSIYFAI